MGRGCLMLQARGGVSGTARTMRRRSLAAAENPLLRGLTEPVSCAGLSDAKPGPLPVGPRQASGSSGQACLG